MSRFAAAASSEPTAPLDGRGSESDSLFGRYLDRVLAELDPASRADVTSTAICLAAFAEIDRLGPRASAAAFALIGAIRSGRLAPMDLWLCSAALRKVVRSSPSSCSRCRGALGPLLRHPSGHVRHDAVAALAGLRQAAPGSRPAAHP